MCINIVDVSYPCKRRKELEVNTGSLASQQRAANGFKISGGDNQLFWIRQFCFPNQKRMQAWRWRLLDKYKS
ncbi:hypothetical protein TSUD_179800 [Trifolium subterraneum]|uniref:Uncharacterized protein n=1 Tax=Trifolium subterraneum TaxID=3900 RepID=A0A2Z6NWT2_TRISU|nr:hypothetical protein TSUD_179800 [Trifolium subterraneum]